ncbi:ubiquitin family protein [Entamoeba histolytica HM-1:IMSS-B]|uniref:Ubiquitin-like domain-containing protein n=6 Tax=Entamoeba histolytica TaxID=5759 RepID=C4LX78_ENTH1|nr:hypothetical protein EHI_013080 [Entamoeba histolytica HM-1:IMSS]EMD42865.1 ubiquitin family protein [Entamoeba histolytica KU27]EMH76861.1 ubiquitin family protein [Entamoeba histolytica HM-1:IMSS-B]EMS11010.1 ubiquitin family protein [Entamoeba histolytica HM-3:IMSS]ENY63813.1 ubiquitin family protein, putative [Entamoeba histolytica HM-1:IMSS-A]GAT93345.1 hypothetical protein CL6EHI_013080 [Entamoeba histolytica]|eukprot:XP_656328.1 hypothetical protein EHI_013080 [Entamoeba histolytica HM-1:IMSS]
MPFTNQLAEALRGLTGKTIYAASNGEYCEEYQLEDYSLLLIQQGSLREIQNVGPVTVKVQLLTGDIADIHCNANELVDIFKMKIQLVTGNGDISKGIPIERQRLSFNKQILDRKRTIDSYGITEGSLVHIILRLRSSIPKKFILHTLIDPQFDYDFRGINDAGKSIYRGQLPYIRPVGCMRCALHVLGMFDNGNDIWLGCSNRDEEWPVSFHGSNCSKFTEIVQWGDKLGVSGVGGMAVFCTPDFRIALQHSDVVTDPQTGRKYKVIFQNRVRRSSIIRASNVGGPDNFWYITNPSDVRAYSICLFSQ